MKKGKAFKKNRRIASQASSIDKMIVQGVVSVNEKKNRVKGDLLHKKCDTIKNKSVKSPLNPPLQNATIK